MVITRCRGEAAFPLASSLTETMSRSEKAAAQPSTAAIKTAPVLSAREASKSPATSSAGFNPFIFSLTFPFRFVFSVISFPMLASDSDKAPRLLPLPLRAEHAKGRFGP
jgi:hypothetical protein